MKKIIIVLCIIMACYTNQHAQEVICIAPVADLTGDSPTTSATKTYDTHILNGPANTINRIDQLIFNERAIRLETNGTESRIQVPTHGYGEPYHNTVHYEYWIKTEYITARDELEETRAIPSAQNIHQIITLIQPFYDNKHYRYYSIGTSFVLDDTQDNAQYYRILVLSPQLKTGHVYLPKEIAIQTSTLSNQDKIQQFINILNFLADQPNGYIPYVLGGNSFISLYKNGSVTHDESTHICTAAYPTKHLVHSGFDCASLVHRAAQSVGIPLPVKNSSALKNFLRPLSPNESIENGDIIYIPGHVIVLVDKESAQAVEARSQTHGYGYVHKVPLAELFKEITSTQELVHYHNTKQEVGRLNANRNIIARVPITILKLSSAFDKPKS